MQNIREAKQNLRDLNESLSVLITACEGIKEADFEAQLKRKESLDTVIADTQKRLKDVTAECDEKTQAAKADADAKLADFKKQISDAETALKNLRSEMTVSRETMRESIASERAALLKERQEQIARLDEAIAAKTKTLESMNAAIAEARRKFA